MPPNVQVRTVPASVPCFHFAAGAALISKQPAVSFFIAGSGLAAPLAQWAAWRNSARYAVFVHGLDLVHSNPVYQAGFLPAIRSADLVIANSRYTLRIAVDRGVNASRVKVLNPGVDFPDGVADGLAWRRRLHIEGRKVLLSVGRLVRRKGLPEFITFAMPRIVAQYPNVVLVIVGAEPAAAPRRVAGVRRAIVEAAEKTGLRNNVLLVGSVDDTTLQQAYAAADAFVFPVLDIPGDVEGFGMVAIEAAAQGTPAIGFDVGGVADAVASGHSGSLVPSEDYEALAGAILDWLARERDKTAAACREHAAQFAWDRFGERLVSMCRGLSDTASGAV